MVEDTVQDDADIFLVRLIKQKTKCRIAAEQGVYVVVIKGVVTVIRSRSQDRGEIKSRGANPRIRRSSGHSGCERSWRSGRGKFDKKLHLVPSRELSSLNQPLYWIKVGQDVILSDWFDSTSFQLSE